MNAFAGDGPPLAGVSLSRQGGCGINDARHRWFPLATASSAGSSTNLVVDLGESHLQQASLVDDAGLAFALSVLVHEELGHEITDAKTDEDALLGFHGGFELLHDHLRPCAADPAIELGGRRTGGIAMFRRDGAGEIRRPFFGFHGTDTIEITATIGVQVEVRRALGDIEFRHDNSPSSKQQKRGAAIPGGDDKLPAGVERLRLNLGPVRGPPSFRGRTALGADHSAKGDA